MDPRPGRVFFTYATYVKPYLLFPNIALDSQAIKIGFFMTAVMEIVHLRLRPGVDDWQFLEASDRFAVEVVPLIPGLERREVLRVGDGSYMLVVRFSTREQLVAAPNAVGPHPAAAAFMALVDPQSLTKGHHDILPNYTTFSLTTGATHGQQG